MKALDILRFCPFLPVDSFHNNMSQIYSVRITIRFRHGSL